MGKYRARSNEDRRAKNQRLRLEVCAVPPAACEFLEQARVLVAGDGAPDAKHKDRGPAAKIDALLRAASTQAQIAALKALGKAFGASDELDEAPLQLTVAGLSCVLFADECWDLTTAAARAMQTLGARRPDLVSAAVEARCSRFVAASIEAPRFERISVLAALLSMRSADLAVRRQWTGITRVVAAVVAIYMESQSSAAWPTGLSEADCSRHLLDGIKMTVTLFQASELEIRSVVREVPPPQEEGEGVTSSAPADSDIGCICGYLASLRALLLSPGVARDSSMAAGAALVKLLSLAAKGDVISRLFGAAIRRNADRPKRSRPPDPWLFSAVGEGSTFSTFYGQLPAFSQLCIVRGLLSSLPLEILCVPESAAPRAACLHDGIFDVLTALCDESADHHLRYQALGSLHTCLRQTVVRTQHQRIDRALMAAKQQAVLRVIWNSLEDPSSGISGQIQELFDYLLDVRADSVEDPGKFWAELATRFLALDWKRKGKYVPLTSITSRLGSGFLISLHPSILRDVVVALAHPPVSSVAGTLLEAMLKSLVKAAASAERDCTHELMPSLMHALRSDDEKVKSGALNYGLPIFIKCVPDCLLTVLDSIRADEDFDERGKLWALVAVLRVARAKFQLRELVFSGYDYGSSRPADETRPISYDEMRNALTHRDGELRLAALELLCVCYKTTLELTEPEYELLTLSLPLSLSLDSTSLRSRCRALMGKLFVRIHQSSRQKQIQTKPGEPEPLTVRRMKRFLQWVVKFLCESASPASSFDRKWMALLVFKEFTSVFFAPAQQSDNKQSKLWHAPHDFELSFVFTAEHTLVLVHAVVDSWDRTRQLACEILQMIPGTMLAGFETPQQVASLVSWTRSLVGSPRVKESDAGALILKVLYCRYVQGARWSVKIKDSVQVVATANDSSPALSFCWELVHMLEQQTHLSRQDMERASLQSLVHGLLLTLRYCFSETDFRKMCAPSIRQWRKMVKAILEVLTGVAEISLWAIDIIETSDGDQVVAPKEQMLVVGSWLSCKEMSCLLGTMATRLPLQPTSDCAEKDQEGEPNFLLSAGQIEEMQAPTGQLLMKVLLTTRHNGAIEKTFIAFSELCKKALRSRVTAVSGLCSKWLDSLLSTVIVEDAYTLRRSAGIPFCFIGILYAETDGGQRPLMKRAVETLLEIASSDTSSDVTGRIHSLNVLRSLIKDTELSLDVMPYVAPAFVTAIRGAQSSEWGITNSSSQLFAALIARSMGRQRVNDNTARAGVTAVEFFNRFPELQPFVLATLREAEGLSSHATVDPGAYNALLLLSKLLPSVTTTEGNQLLEAFVPIVGTCCEHKNYMLRCVSAAALAPLIPEDEILAHISKAAAQLPTLHHGNKQHGNVLVLQHLCISFLGGPRTADELATILTTFEPCCALLKDGALCCMVRYDLLNAFEILCRAFDKLNAEAFSDAAIHRVVMSIIAAASSCVLEGHDRRDVKGSVGRLRMRMKAAEVWERVISCLPAEAIASVDIEHSTMVIVSMFKDSTRAMQIHGLKRCKSVLTSAGLRGILDLKTVRDYVLQWGAKEKHEQVLKHVCGVAVHTSFAIPTSSCRTFWAGPRLDRQIGQHPVYRMWHTSAAVAAQQNDNLHSCVAHVVRFMGIVVAQVCEAKGVPEEFVRLPVEQQEDMVSRLHPWVRLVVEGSDATQVSSTRGACVDSLASARVLLRVSYSCGEVHSSPWVEMVVQLWHVLIQLMQDENEDIRVAAAELSWSVTNPDEASWSQPLACIVCKHCVEHLASHLLIENLNLSSLKWFCGQLTGGPEGSSGDEQFHGESRKLFEREEDNQYSEVLLPINLAAAGLHRWCQHCVGSAGENSSNTVAALRHVGLLLAGVFGALQTACDRATTSVEAGMDGEHSHGSSNHLPTFLTVYRLAATLIACAPLRRLSETELGTASGFLLDLEGQTVEGCADAARRLASNTGTNSLLAALLVRAQRCWTGQPVHAEDAPFDLPG